MNKIEEIALRVAEQIEPRGRTYSPDHYVDVVKLVLAELSKDAEPVASVSVGTRTGLDGHVLKFDYGAALRMVVPASGKPIPLFTHPAPVIASEQKPVAWKDTCVTTDENDVETRDPVLLGYEGWETLPAGTELFTSPPNTADIEQRVAEACAKMLEADANALASECGYEDMGSLSFGTSTRAEERMYRYNELLDLAEAFHSSKWREYL